MKPIEDQTLARRFITTFIIVVIILLLLALIGWLTGGWEAQGEIEITPPAPDVSKFAERLDELDIEAIDEAYKTQISHLFAVWMKDATGQPARAIVGAQAARKAYRGARTEIEKRINLREQK